MSERKLERYLHNQNPEVLKQIIKVLYYQGAAGLIYVKNQVKEFDKMYSPHSLGTQEDEEDED